MNTLLKPINDGTDRTLFPLLDEAHLAQLKRDGAVEETLPSGTLFCDEGDRDVDFVVVLEGELEVIQHVGGEEKLIVVHHAGQFLGDTNTLSGRPAIVCARTRGETRLLRLSHQALRRVIVERSELSDLLLRSFLNRRLAMVNGQVGSAKLIGSRFSSDTHRIREFLTRNSYPFTWLDLEDDPETESILGPFGLRLEDTPVLICRGQHVHLNPSNESIAASLGLDVVTVDHAVDVLVVGSGPAGLAASVYAASEGLEVVTIDGSGPGGQAGTSSKIENYLGFPTGISGRDLADRAYLQAQKFGAQMASARTAVKMECHCPNYHVTVSDGTVIKARSVVIASGARYQKLDLPNLLQLEGRGVYYGATVMETSLCRDQPTAVVGGGNSAGQAVVFLSGIASEVHLHVRSSGLSSSMSRYLIRRIEETPKIHLHVHSEVVELIGEEHLEKVRFRCNKSGDVSELRTSSLFTMVGATPSTSWLCPAIALDEKGFIRTGQDLSALELSEAAWEPGRQPFAYETSCPRVFAVGDVRSKSTKRVATAVGEGSAAISFLHQAIADLI